MTSISVAAGELFVAKSLFSVKRMFSILFVVTVAGIPSLKELPGKEFSPADVLIAEMSLATETYPAATVLLPSNKLFCISPIVIRCVH